MSLFAELKRRNVFKVAAAYVIVGWLIMQVGDTLAPALHLPSWINSALAFFLILGFPLALFFAWAFELTPEGIRKEKEVDRAESITHVTSRKLNALIVAMLVVALGYFAFDKFVLDPGRDASQVEDAVQTAQQAAPAADEQQSIAILPFVNMSSDPEQEYFSDGLSEELLNLLAKVPELRVAARTSSFSFKNQDLEIPEIAQRLGVANVLEGSVRKSGDQLRITAQLIKADDGFHLWSETYDRTLDNIFVIQDEIAAAVVESLKVTLLGETPKSRETDPEAFRLYLEGQYIGYQRTTEAMAKAIELFRQAVEVDPAYAPAWAELAYMYLWYSGAGSMSIDAGIALADQAIDKALGIDPGYGWAHYVKGVSLANTRFRFREAGESYMRAHELDPGNAQIRSARGFAAMFAGRFDEALVYASEAVALDPVMPELHRFLASAYWRVGNLEQAEAAFRKSLELSPNFVGVRHRIARILIQKGQPEAALAIAQQEVDTMYRLTGESMAHFAMGNQAEADRTLAELTEKFAEGGAYQIAQIYGMRGDANQAFAWLDQAVANRDSGISNIIDDPSFRSVATDPRYEAFLERFALAETWRNLPPEWGGPQG